ncbi:MAG: DegT/DnrJ/EryC1/StrS family aminotransferase [Candidatus Nealsonbacteria bacterium]|nr:DegT/DnrJ/EryC1/StrS family aminotransferase [Candidatus Nealsonbacteria bacterium]
MKYKVRFVNPQKQYQDHKKEFSRTFDDVLSRGDLICRKDLAEFEEKIAKYVGVKYAVGLNSGTDALSLAMEAAGIRQGDEVITVGHTFLASISVIYHQRAKAVLIDVGQDFNMNPDLIEKAITKKTRAIEPVHLNGRVCDMDKIMAIAKKHNLIVIEDAAQALGAKFKVRQGQWKMAGSFGLAGCFSMYPFKALGAFGDAGVLTTNDKKMARDVTRLRYNGEDRQTRKFYSHGRTALLDNLQAAFLSVKMKYFPEWVERRRAIAKIYYQELKDLPSVVLPQFADPRFRDSYQNYAIRAEKRDHLKKYLAEKGVETLISWDIPMYRQPVMMPNKIRLPETEKICRQVLSLPMYPELTDEQVRFVAKRIRQFYD